MFNQEACACFSQAQCEIACAPGTTLLPTEICSGCVPESELESIYGHGLDDQCRASGLDIGDLEDLGFINIFIFNAPIYGDIYGVSNTDLCENGLCQKIEERPTDGEDSGGEEISNENEHSGSDETTEVDPPPIESLTPEVSLLGYFFTP